MARGPEGDEEDLQTMIDLLKAEVKPALGCTEPAAVAFTVAKARDFLGGSVSRIQLGVSGNIYKNALAVTLPNTQETGLELAAALGLCKGDANKGLQVFADVGLEAVITAKEIVRREAVEVRILKVEGVYIEARVEGENGWSVVVVSGGHTHVTRAEVNGIPVFQAPDPMSLSPRKTRELSGYRLEELIQIVEQFPLDEIAFLQEGIVMNLAMSEAGLSLNAGLAVGSGLKSLMKAGLVSSDLINRIRMTVAAAADARMAGVDQPVMSTMGSGNQGIGAIIPVAVVAQERHASPEQTLRALALSHLTTAYVKAYTGKLSTMCGCAVASGVGSAAALAWLLGGTKEQVAGAIMNLIGNLSGMICDGAKGGCALKLSTSSVEALLAANLALQGVVIHSTDGIIGASAEESIRNLGRLSVSGMVCAEETILDIMLHKEKATV